MPETALLSAARDSVNIDTLFTPGVYRTSIGSYGALVIVWKYDSYFIFQLVINVNESDMNPRVRFWNGRPSTPYWTSFKQL